MTRRSGLTLVELVVAAGLLSLLMVGVFTLLDDFLSMWEKSEHRRALVEETSGVLELFAYDLTKLEPGQRGDVLGEWEDFDRNSDGVADTVYPRLRFVRHASPAELQRLQAGSASSDPGQGLLEVCWTLLPAHPGTTDVDLRAEGFLWRGERIYGGEPKESFFADEFLSQGGAPRPGAVNEVSGGVLWLGVQFATQTSLIHDGWRMGGDLRDTAASWDAWNRVRPNPEVHWWNEPGAGMPPARGRPVLPRRVRVELEIERTKDLKRRTRLERDLDSKGSRLSVVDGQRLPEPGAFVLVDQEWMEITAVTDDSASVRRGQRGSTAAMHESGALVHFGQPAVREIPVPLFQEDWNL